MTLAVRTADEADQEWLDMKIEMLGSGVDAAVDIAANWISGRNVGRLYPGLSASNVIRERLGAFRFGKADIARLLAETPLSNRQIATVTGASEPTVRRLATASSDAVQRPEKTLGADGKLRSYPPIEIIDPPAAPVADTEGYRELLAALRAVSALAGSVGVVLSGITDQQFERLRGEARRVERLAHTISNVTRF